MNDAARLLRNARLAAATVFDHLGDDPALLALQISRRLPARVAVPGAGVLRRVPGNTVLPALAAHILGDAEDTARRLNEALGYRSHRTRLRAADVALAAHRPDLAEGLLSSVPGNTRGKAETQARNLWYRGEMTAAVRELENTPGRRAAGQRRRLEAELGAFSTFRPTLPALRHYEPREGTVLHVLTNSLPHTESGYAQRTHSLLAAQQRSGLSVHAVTRLGYPVQIGRLLARDRDTLDGVTYHRLLAAKLPEGMTARLQEQAERLLDLALQVRPEILHTTTHFVNALVTEAVADALGIPWIYEVRGQLADTWAGSRPMDVRTSERYLLFRQREAEAAASASLVATLGHEMKRELVEAGLPADRVLLLPNAVGDDFLQEPSSPMEARRRLGLPPEVLLVGTVSSLVEYEGIDDLLRALSLLDSEEAAVHGLIVGDGAAASALRSQAREMGLADRVHFTGRVPRNEAALYHQALDVFVVPRRDLAVTRAVTPLKPVEALASGRPVIASDLPALHEIVTDGKGPGEQTGAFFPPGDWRSLAQRLREILADEDQRRRLGTSGRAYVLRERTWEANARAAANEYARLRK